MSPILRTATEYSAITNINGLHYVFDRQYGNLSRIFWFLVSIGVIVIAALLINKSYKDWQESLVLTTVNSTGHRIGKLDFPAITICGQGMTQSLVEDVVIRQIVEFVIDTRGVEIADDGFSTELLNYYNLTTRDFLAKTYPGIPTNVSVDELVTVATLFSSFKPDSFLDSWIAQLLSSKADILESLCSNETNERVICGNSSRFNYTFDGSYICYRIAGLAKGGYDGINALCDENEDEVMFVVVDDDQLQSFIQLVANKSGPLASLAKNSTFWAFSYPDDSSTDIMLTDTLKVKSNRTEPQLDNLIITPSNKTEMSTNKCFRLIYDLVRKKLVGQRVKCEQTEAQVVCIKEVVPKCTQQQQQPSGGEKVEVRHSALDYLMDPNLRSRLKQVTAYFRTTYKNGIRNLDVGRSYKNLFELLWHTHLPCFESEMDATSRALLRYCVWKGQSIPCAAIFSTFPTDRGMCCTFNMEAADKIFKDSAYQKMVVTMQEKDKNYSMGSSLPDSYINKKEPIPQAGINKGLTLILDAHTNILGPGSVQDDFQGFIAIIGSPNQYPMIGERNIRIRPGHANLVGISAIRVESADRIRSVTPENRNCFFKDEYTKLKLHKEYSQENCVLECQMEYGRNGSGQSNNSRSTDCTPWFLPSSSDNGGSGMCDPWEAEGFMLTMQDAPGDQCDHCLPDCTFTEYRSSVTALPFRQCDEQNLGVSFLCNLNDMTIPSPPLFANQITEEYNNTLPDFINMESNIRGFEEKGNVFPKLANKTYDAYEKDIAMVTFYFESPTVFQYSRDLKMTWVDFAGQLGGFLGLCNGFSICSLMEILFWFSVVLRRNVVMDKRVQKGQFEKRAEIK